MKKRWQILIFIGLLGLTGWIIYTKVDYKNLRQALYNADIRFLLIGLFCMIVFWGIEAGLIHVLTKKVVKNVQLWTSIKVTLIGQYYACITPFASGGQPAQLYELRKDHIPSGRATAVLVSKFLLFQITVTLYALVLAIIRMHYLIAEANGATGFIFTGLLINIVGLAGIIMMAYKPNVLKKVAAWILYKLAAMKLLHNSEKKMENFQHHMDEYRVSISRMKADKLGTFYLFLFSIIQLTVFFSITYFIYKALGLNSTTMLNIISLQALLYMAVSFIPVPGTVGVSEAGFVLLLGGIFSANLVTVALILWRGISYYFGLIFCGIFTFLIYLLDKSRRKKSVVT